MLSDRMQRQVDRLLDAAEEAVEQLNWTVVRDRALAALALDAENSDALAYLAAAEKQLGVPFDELRAMGRLGSHPNIVTVFDMGEIPSTDSGQAGQPHLVTELMAGGDVAAAHFEDALAFCRKAGYRPELAWSLFDYGDLLVTQSPPNPPAPFPSPTATQPDPKEGGGEVLRQKAVALLDEALTISRELRMRPLMERVLSRREIKKA